MIDSDQRSLAEAVGRVIDLTNASLAFWKTSRHQSMSLQDAAQQGDLEALRERIARGDDVDGRDGAGATPLRWACGMGHLECVQALIDANAAVDMVNNNGDTALIIAVESTSLDEIREECDVVSDGDDDSDEDSDMDEEELEQRNDERRQQRSERRLEERRQGKAWCVQALLEAMAPIRGADYRELAASFKCACERLRVLGQVVAASHVIEHASVLVKARVVTLTADAQDIVIDFARAVFAT